jgi:hypothetical protein
MMRLISSIKNKAEDSYQDIMIYAQKINHPAKK